MLIGDTYLAEIRRELRCVRRRNIRSMDGGDSIVANVIGLVVRDGSTRAERSLALLLVPVGDRHGDGKAEEQRDNPGRHARATGTRSSKPTAARDRGSTYPAGRRAALARSIAPHGTLNACIAYIRSAGYIGVSYRPRERARRDTMRDTYASPRAAGPRYMQCTRRARRGAARGAVPQATYSSA